LSGARARYDAAVFRFVLPLVLSVAALVPLAAAQDKAKPDIVVNGQLDRQIEALVRRFTTVKNDRQIARWDSRICARVLGLWPERATYLTDRIAAVAKSIGAGVSTNPKCAPNVLIVFTPFADAFAADVVRNHPGYVQNVDLFGLPRGSVKARYLAPRPVRWFTINNTVMADGSAAGAVPKTKDEPPHISFTPPSRIRLSTRENTVLSLIVVDEPQMAGIKWSQLGDYLAMVSLGQPKMDADYSGEDSVLAIFADRDAGLRGPLELTKQDRDLLVALYKSDPALRPNQQRSEIERYYKKQRGAAPQ